MSEARLIRGIKRLIKHPTYVIIRLASKGIVKIDDEKYIKMMYKIVFNKEINLDNPKTFNEKLHWLKLNNRKPEYTKMVDKYEVKKYISDIIGEEYVIPTIGVYNNFDEIDFEKLPNQFVMKCTHDSNSTIICKNKNTFNKKKNRKIINKKLHTNYYLCGREWPYKNVKPRIIIEEYLEDRNVKQNSIRDYKLMCFNGKVKLILICSNRGNKNTLTMDFYDLNWNKLEIKRKTKNSTGKLEKPKNLDLMISFAERLSNNIPFIRIDFYEVNKKLYFGEVTFYPANGFEKFEPNEYDEILGNMIKL